MAWAGLLLGAIPLECSNDNPSTDAGADAFVSTPCSTNAECPSGTHCVFTVPDCSPHAQGSCLPPALPVACKAGFECSCSGVTVSTCGGSLVPIRSLGPCEAGPCGGDCCAAFACELCDVSGYAPVTMSTPVATPNACAPADIANAVSACYGASATPQTCAAWQATEADAGTSACASCVVSLQSSATWAPFVCTANACDLNIPGCVDLVLGQVTLERSSGGTGSCGDRFSDSYGCQDYSCVSCPTAEFGACTQAAAANECKSYADATLNGPCAVLEGDASPPSAMDCFPQTSTDVAKLVNVFCGTAP